MNNVLTKRFYPKLTIQEFHEDSQIFIQEYSCPLCEGILNESVIDKCGHSFCKDCIKVLVKETNKCPFTNNEIMDISKLQINQNLVINLSSNIILNSVIEKQKVYCKNKANNCEWVGKLLERKNHLLYDCEKELVECEFSNECKEKVTRDQLHLHMQECPHRIVLCHHCQEYVNHNKIEEHYKDCPNIPMACKCGISVPKSKLLFHIEYQCENTVVECPFNVVGCEFVETRMDLKVHLNDNLEQHLKMINKKIKNLDDVINDQKKQITDLEVEKDELKNKITNTNSLIAKNQEEMVNSINTLYKNMENMRLYMNVPQTNYIPMFFNLESNTSNSFKNNSNVNGLQTNQIFKIENDNLTIMKIQENYGWYGVSSEVVNLDLENTFNGTGNNFTNKMNSNNKCVFVANMKIIKTVNFCIMFGITFSSLKSPLQNGFYQRTEDEDISYMLYTYNSSVYYRGRSIGQNQTSLGHCIDGDVISLIIDGSNNTISFRKNGIVIVEPMEIKLLALEDYRKNFRVAVDMCDYLDEVMFLI